MKNFLQFNSFFGYIVEMFKKPLFWKVTSCPSSVSRAVTLRERKRREDCLLLVKQAYTVIILKDENFVPLCKK